MRKQLKLLTMNGRRPLTKKVPGEILSYFERMIPEFQKLWHSNCENPSFKFAGEFLASCGQLIPNEFGESLLERFEDKESNISAITYGNALGDLEYKWQKELWEKIKVKCKNKMSPFARKCFGIAVGRSDIPLKNIDRETAVAVLNLLLQALEKTVRQLKNRTELTDQGYERQLA